MKEGGALFEVYLSMFAPMGTAVKLTKLRKQRRDNHLPVNTAIVVNENKKLMDRHMKRYYDGGDLLDEFRLRSNTAPNFWLYVCDELLWAFYSWPDHLERL